MRSNEFAKRCNCLTRSRRAQTTSIVGRVETTLHLIAPRMPLKSTSGRATNCRRLFKVHFDVDFCVLTNTICSEYLDTTRNKLIGISMRHILNMDEVPVYMDMVPTSTLHFKGDSDVQMNNSGHSKDRFTVALTCTAAGTMLKAYVLFKNLKRVPKLNVPSNVHVNVSMSGSMRTAEVSGKCKRRNWCQT